MFKIIKLLILIVITSRPHLLNFLLGTGNKVAINKCWPYIKSMVGACMLLMHCSYNSCKSSIKGLEVFTITHLSSTPGRARVGIIGDLQESFDIFPTPGDNFMLQILYICIGILRQMPQPLGQNMLTNCYISPPIARLGVGGN